MGRVGAGAFLLVFATTAAAQTFRGGINSIPGVLLPLDSVEEYSVQTQAGAETGRNPGGVVNLVIKSGTNQPHGSGYYYNWMCRSSKTSRSGRPCALNCGSRCSTSSTA
jgi:hypothetical protein